VSGLGYFAFTGKTGEMCQQQLENDDAFYVAQLKARIPAGVTPLPLVKSAIVEMLRDSLSLQRAKDHLAKALQGLKEGDSLTGLKGHDNLISAGVTDTVTQQLYVPGVGINNAAAAAAFSLEPLKRSGIVTVGNSVYVVRLLWIDRVASIPWDSPEISTIRRQLAGEAAQRAYADWYMALRRHERIVDNLAEYYPD
jgi:hypothetical protein